MKRRHILTALMISLSSITTVLFSQNSQMDSSDEGEGNLNTMSAAELANAPPAKLQQAIATLSEELKEGQILYKQITAFNKALCERLMLLNSQCLAQAYLRPPIADNLACSGKGGTASGFAPVIKVIATGLKGYRFRIQANTHYYSDEFGEGGGVITFQRDDNQPVQAPRFRELTMMNLISVTTGSQINSLGRIQSANNFKAGDQAALVSSMKFMITLNDRAIVDDPNVKTLVITPPTDANSQSQLRVDPEAILKMGKNSTCMVSLSEVEQIRKKSEAASGAGGSP